MQYISCYFNHLLFTMCDINVGGSGIRGDTRKYYYCEVEKFLKIYGTKLGLCGANRYKFVKISMDEFVC